MTEYWKSQARKYCEFCKCWFADNKVSISFHENGKKHKENVQKHISQLTKKSSKDFKQKEKLDDDMKKMEEAAMAAYLKDVQNNADLTSQTINSMLGESGASNADITVASATPVNTTPAWQEVKGDDGTYYWNTATNETTWDPPDDYVSLAKQEENKLKNNGEEKRKQKFKKQQKKEAIMEAKCHLAREQMRELSVRSEPAARGFVPVGPAPPPEQPYGAWKAVINEAPPQIDLQLPRAARPAPAPALPEPEPVFGERTAPSLGDGPVHFKRRKLNNPKRNIRQKTADDE